MKKLLPFFLIAVLLLGLFSGCGSSEKPQEKEDSAQSVQMDSPEENRQADKAEKGSDEYAEPTMPEMPQATLQVQCPFTWQTAVVTYNSFFFNQTDANHINYWESPYSVQVNFNVVDCDEEGEILIGLQRMLDEVYDPDSAEFAYLEEVLSAFYTWSVGGDCDVYPVGFVAGCDAEGLRKQFIADNIQYYGYTPIETIEVGEKTIHKFTSYRHDNQQEYDSYYVYEFGGNVLFMTLYSFMDNGAMIFADMFLVDVTTDAGVG